MIIFVVLYDDDCDDDYDDVGDTVVLVFMMLISPCSAVGHPKDLTTAVAFKEVFKVLIWKQ